MTYQLVALCSINWATVYPRAHLAIKLVPGLFPTGKVAGSGIDHPPPSGTEVKERVQLSLYSPAGPLYFA
jgi:hypothetical protein